MPGATDARRDDGAGGNRGGAAPSSGSLTVRHPVREGGLRSRGEGREPGGGRPLLSVITVVLNGAQFLEQTVRSVVGQSGADIEYLIIDGGSGDGTLEIIGRYEDAVDYWLSEPDRGIYDAMNKGVSLARGEWINFMNAGDIFCEASTVERVFSEVQNAGEYDCIYSDTLFDCHGGVKRVACDIRKGRFIHQSIIYKKELHTQAGPYLVAPGVTISDYLFFMVQRDRKWVKHERPICSYSPYGLTSGKDTYRQKIAVDVMLGCLGRVPAALLLIGHPLYHALKRLPALLGSLVRRG
jgi:glycosyltransferase involved in cell wall biosynthesis